MTTMISEVYDALRDAQGVSDEKARKAAEAVAQCDTRFTALEQKFDKLRVDFEALKVSFEELKGRVDLIQWQLGFLIAGVAALVLKAFSR